MGILMMALLAWATAARAVPVDGTCTLDRLWQTTYSPVNLPPFVVPLAGEAIDVSIDPEVGSLVLDGSGLPPLHFRNGFSDAWDVLTFPPAPLAGTIDSGGNIVVPGFQFRVCTFGTCPGGGGDCDCVPSNLCSNDTTHICSKIATSGELACDAGATCQGVCSDDWTKTCANDAACAPTGHCGTGSLLRLTADLTTGSATFGDVSLSGSADSVFVDGKIILVDLFATSPETPVIGDTGVTSVTIGCTLSPVPDGTALPPPPAWTPKKGTIKLGKGAAGTGDDKLALKGDFLPLAGEADFDSEDLVVTLGTPAATVVSLRVPAGSLVANKKGTKWKFADKTGAVVEVSPPLLPGSEPSFKLGIKKKKDGRHALALRAKNLNLDGLSDAGQVKTGIGYGFQTPSATSALTAKGSKLKF
jgi:hypothetical protein